MVAEPASLARCDEWGFRGIVSGRKHNFIADSHVAHLLCLLQQFRMSGLGGKHEKKHRDYGCYPFRVGLIHAKDCIQDWLCRQPIDRSVETVYC